MSQKKYTSSILAYLHHYQILRSKLKNLPVFALKQKKVDEKNKLKKMRVGENFWVKSVQNPKLCLVYLNKNEKFFFQKMF